MAEVKRFDFVQYGDEAKKLNNEITELAISMESSLEKLEGGREKSLALTKLEECVMWARKALR